MSNDTLVSTNRKRTISFIVSFEVHFEILEGEFGKFRKESNIRFQFNKFSNCLYDVLIKWFFVYS